MDLTIDLRLISNISYYTRYKSGGNKVKKIKSNNQLNEIKVKYKIGEKIAMFASVETSSVW